MNNINPIGPSGANNGCYDDDDCYDRGELSPNPQRDPNEVATDALLHTNPPERDLTDTNLELIERSETPEAAGYTLLDRLSYTFWGALGYYPKTLSTIENLDEFIRKARSTTPAPSRIDNFDKHSFTPEVLKNLKRERKVEFKDEHEVREVRSYESFLIDFARSGPNLTYFVEDKQINHAKKEADENGQERTIKLSLEEKFSEFWPLLLEFWNQDEEKARNALLYCSQHIFTDANLKIINFYFNPELGFLPLKDLKKEFRFFRQVESNGDEYLKIRATWNVFLRKMDGHDYETLPDGTEGIFIQSVTELYLDGKQANGEPLTDRNGKTKIYFRNQP